MKNSKNIILFTIALLIAFACNDENIAVDYTDDNAYPPPVINISTSSSLSNAEFKTNQNIAGVVESKNGLRDVYITLLKKTGDIYEEINRNYRVYKILDGFPNEQDFSLDIAISDKETAAIGIFATDIYTKTSTLPVIIENLKGIPPLLTLEPAQIDAVDLNESVTITGTASSGVGLKSITYALVRKSPYNELSTPQQIEVSASDNEKTFTFTIEMDDERTDAIGVVVTDNDGYKETGFVDILSITGIPEGRANIYENIEMAPEWENPTNPTLPYIFSFEGVNVNGIIKNVVGLQDVVDASSGNIDFALVNFWRNSSFAVIANRGPGFASADRITSGTVGRQVDTPWLSAIGKNATFFKLIPPEMAASMNLDNFFETTIGNWETYQELDKLSTFVTGTGTGDKQILQRTGASSDRTDNSNLQIVDGSYIAIRRVFAGNVKYGIIKVVTAVDDSVALNENNKILGVTSEPGKSQYYRGPNQEGFEYTGVTKLYGKRATLKIIVQQ